MSTKRPRYRTGPSSLPVPSAYLRSVGNKSPPGGESCRGRGGVLAEAASQPLSATAAETASAGGRAAPARAAASANGQEHGIPFRVEDLERRVAELENEKAGLEARVANLEGQLSGVDARLAALEALLQNVTRRDAGGPDDTRSSPA